MAEASSAEDVITLRIRFKSETFEKFAERYAADLTSDEIFIRTRQPLPVGTPLALDFSLNDGSPLLAGRAAVAWTREPEQAAGAPAGMGIHFEELNDPSQQMLRRILEAKAALSPAATPIPSADREPAPAPRPPEKASEKASTRASEKATLKTPAVSATPTQRGQGSSPKPSPTPPGGSEVGNRSTRPVATPTASAAVRQARNSFGSDYDEEPTELAHNPPSASFFYEEADQEKTKLQDPRANAELLRQKLSDAQDDDVTNVRSAASLFNQAAMRGPTTPGDSAFEPRRTPARGAPLPGTTAGTGDRPAPARGRRNTPASSPASPSSPGPETPGRRAPSRGGGESPFPIVGAPLSPDNTDRHPLIISTNATTPMPVEPGRPLRPPATVPTRASSPGQGTRPGQGSPPPALLEGEGFTGPSPSFGSAEMRWSGGNLETMPTAPGVPMVKGFGDVEPMDPNVAATPGWQVPAVDPGGRLRSEAAPAESEAQPGKGRLASIRMWVVLTLAAGALVTVALLVLPALLRTSPGATQAPSSPPAQPSAPSPSAPPAGTAPAAQAAPGEAAPSAPVAAAAAEKEAAPSGAGAESPPAAAEVAAPAGAGTAPPAAAADQAETASPPAKAAAAEAPERGLNRNAAGPGRARPAPTRRSTREVLAAAEARDRPAPGEIDGDPVPAVAPATSPPADTGQEVYWLTLRSSPSGADVLIDGQVEGTTPFVRRIFDPSRSYSIVIRRAGFEPQERTVSATDGWTRRGNVRSLTLIVKLVAGPADSDPARAGPGRGPESLPAADPSEVTPPPTDPDRKTNPFAEPASPGGSQPQPQ